MPTGSDAVRDERRRIANVIGAIPAADLWTSKRLRDGSVDGASSAATDKRSTFKEGNYQSRLELAEAVDLWRTFQVHLAALEDMERHYSAGEHDVVVELDVDIGYDVRGGNSLYGTWAQVEEVAAQDAERVRQELQHPANRTAGSATGVTTGFTAQVTIGRIDLRPFPDRDRLIASMRVRSELSVTTEDA